MPGLAAQALLGHTFGVSYTGNIPWGGLEQYIRDAHGYAGENKRSGTISIEVFTVGENFSLCVMQPGKIRRWWMRSCSSSQARASAAASPARGGMRCPTVSFN